MKNPWDESPLDTWSIGAMNHYWVYNKETRKKERYLFVIMTKGMLYIKEEGKDEEALWKRLAEAATAAEYSNPAIVACKHVVDFVENCVIHSSDSPEVIRFIDSLKYKTFYFQAKRVLGEEVNP